MPIALSADLDVTHQFRGWDICPEQRLLIVNGKPADVGARAFDVLLALVQRRGKVVTKDEMLAIAWPGRVVEENNISVQVATLRRVLGPRSIATIAGIGYRLSAEPAVSAHSSSSMAASLASTASRPLPYSAPLFGRDGDIASLLELIGRVPLLTITGTGGVGKTSLARAVLGMQATRVGTEDIYWIDLAPIGAHAPIDTVIAQALGVLGAPEHAQEDLLRGLTQSRALIALDNCEHLAGPVARLLTVALDNAVGVRWLATSQVPLHVAQEHVYQLQPLDIPAHEAGLAQAGRAGALALLRARAAAVYRPFELTSANVDQAIDLCRRLDGLPLAIEMAASRIGTLGLKGVYDQLDQKLRLSSDAYGTPERQQTLRQTLEWSYSHLSMVEQRVLRRLEPFLGGFTAGMARQMACASTDVSDGPVAWEALEALSVLVERSLVQRVVDLDAAVEARYFLLESARDFARAMLAEAGEASQMQRLHAEVIAKRFALARSDLDRMRDAEWAVHYVAERHNVRAALAWACEADEPNLVAQLCAALARIDTFSRGQAEILQCRVPMQTMLLASPPLRACACVELSWAHFLDGSRKVGTELALQALDDFRAEGDTAGVYQALAQLVRLYESRPGLDEAAQQAARALSELDETEVPLRSRLFRAITAGLQYEGQRTVAKLTELHELARRAGYDTLAAVCRVHITDQLLIEGRFDEVVETARRFVDAGESRPRVGAMIRINLVLALIQLGRAVEAVEPALFVRRALPNACFHVIRAFALAAVREGRAVDGAYLMGYCERVRLERDQRDDPAEAAANKAITEALEAAIDTVTLRELLHLGGSLSADDVWSFVA